jgi:hypothetical protein
MNLKDRVLDDSGNFVVPGSVKNKKSEVELLRKENKKLSEEKQLDASVYSGQIKLIEEDIVKLEKENTELNEALLAEQKKNEDMNSLKEENELLKNENKKFLEKMSKLEKELGDVAKVMKGKKKKFGDSMFLCCTAGQERQFSLSMR